MDTEDSLCMEMAARAVQHVVGDQQNQNEYNLADSLVSLVDRSALSNSCLEYSDTILMFCLIW